MRLNLDALRLRQSLRSPLKDSLELRDRLCMVGWLEIDEKWSRPKMTRIDFGMHGMTAIDRSGFNSLEIAELSTRRLTVLRLALMMGWYFF